MLVKALSVFDVNSGKQMHMTKFTTAGGDFFLIELTSKGMDFHVKAQMVRTEKECTQVLESLLFGLCCKIGYTRRKLKEISSDFIML